MRIGVEAPLRWDAAIGGRTRSGDDTFTVTDPARGELVGAVEDSSEADVDAAVASAQEALATSGWATTLPFERGAVLRRMAALVRANAERLAELETRCNGQPIVESRRQIDGAAILFDYYGGLVPALAGTSPAVAADVLDVTRVESYGVCGLILAFNAPFSLFAMKAAPALAAGNAVVVKPSPLAPLTALVGAELAVEAGFPDGLVNVLTTSSIAVSRHVVRHVAVPKISFTGSVESGVEILRDAAAEVKHVTLELGGKSASIVCADADLAAAVDGSVYFAMFRSGGQICTHRTRVLVDDGVYDEFVDRFVESARRLRVGDPLDSAVQVGPLVSAQQVDRVDGFVRRAVTEGAHLALGGSRQRVEGLDHGCFYAPTVLVDVDNSMEIAQSEVFGPVASIIRCSGLDEAVEIANSTRYGLAATIWSADVPRALTVANRLDAGNVSINHAPIIYPWAPFSGFKHSGLGVEMGIEGLREYTRLKNVLVGLR